MVDPERHQSLRSLIFDRSPVYGSGRNFLFAAIAYVLYASLLIVALWPSVATLIGQWLSSSTYHHAPLAAPLALWLIWRRRDRAAPPAPCLPAGLAIGVLALVWAAGRMAKADIVEHFAFVSLLIAGVCLIFGARNARAFAFPLAFLYFMVPFGASALPALQETTTGLAATLLNLVGVNAGRAGFIITTAAGPFHIAPSCAGLNFLLASLMIASLFAETALSGWRARVGFVFAAAVLAIAANALRAAIVIGAATLLGGAIAADHILFGLIFYAMLIAALIAAGGRLARAS